jgi:hypothetical protein
MRFRSSLVSKPLTQSVASGSGQDVFVLDNTFALIDAYICADLSIATSLFPCSQTADHTFQGTTGRHLSDKATFRPGGLLSVGSDFREWRRLVKVIDEHDVAVHIANL